MASHPLAPHGPDWPRTHWRRLPLLAGAAAAVATVDLGWKTGALAATPDAVAIDTPTTALRPLTTLLLAVVAIAGGLLLPRLCLPGALLVLGGAVSNVASIVVWHGVPDPLSVGLGWGVLHFNPADVSVWSGSVLFLAAAYLTIWQLPTAPAA